MTDEDEQIARLEIHRDIIGWVIAELITQGGHQSRKNNRKQSKR